MSSRSEEVSATIHRHDDGGVLLRVVLDGFGSDVVAMEPPGPRAVEKACATMSELLAELTPPRTLGELVPCTCCTTAV